MSKALSIALALLGTSLFLSACSSNPPKSEQEKTRMEDDSQVALSRMKEKDPGLQDFLDRSYGYAIFPSVGKGGLGVGGSYGRGEVFEQGRKIGYATLSQASIGLQAGGQEFSELVVFQNPTALNQFTAGQLSFSADASAVALKSGAAGSTNFRNGVAVFTMPKGGLMFEASIGGQSFTYHPL